MIIFIAILEIANKTKIQSTSKSSSEKDHLVMTVIPHDVKTPIKVKILKMKHHIPILSVVSGIGLYVKFKSLFLSSFSLK